MKNMNKSENEILERVTEHMTFEKEEISLIKKLASNNDYALSVIGDIIFAYGRKEFVIDVLEELSKETFQAINWFHCMANTIRIQ